MSQKEKPAKTTKKRSPKPVTLTWQAVEPSPRKRWWWWIVMTYIALLVLLLFISYEIWTGAALTIAIVAAVIATYGTKPRTRRYKLSGTTLHIDSKTHDLTRYNRSTITSLDDESDDLSGLTVELLPKALLAPALQIILPGDEKKADKTLQAITDRVPLDMDDPYAASGRVLQRLARWLRIG